MSTKYFSLAFLFLVGGYFAYLTYLSFNLQVFTGDLTRIGGFRESHYGWNAPQQGFAVKGTDYYRKLDDIHGSYDVLVIGDSFSHICAYGGANACVQWQAHLFDRTGLRVATLDVNHVTMEQMLDAAHPLPAPLVVFQSVERLLPYRLKFLPDACPPERAGKLREPALIAKAQQLEQLQFRRARQVKPLDYNLPVAYVRQRFDDDKGTEVYEVPLMRSDLFSHERADHVLVISHDYKKREYSPARRDAIRCQLEQLKYQFEKLYSVPLVVMIAPDKASIYGSYAAKDKYRARPLFADLGDLDLVPLYPRISNAVAAGRRDVYLPNDTHWGFAGGQLAADTLAEYLVARGWLLSKGD